MNCRHCDQLLEHVFLDLGFAPPSNAYLSVNDLNTTENYFPLKLLVCTQCWLVQTQDVTDVESLFTDEYAYFSSVSQGWLKHAQDYCVMIEKRLNLNKNSFVIEIAANDGYLLRNFVDRSIPCLGIEPTKSTADAAEKIAVPILRRFFNSHLADELILQGKQADLIVGNNVFAHVPDINDFSLGMRKLLKETGVITLEFPHLQQLIDKVQFDTVYHEHFSYLSLTSVISIFSQAGLRVFDVESLPTHGGSLRIYACHQHNERESSEQVERLLSNEKQFGLCDLSVYTKFQWQAEQVKNGLLIFLIQQKMKDKSVVAYGAAAKGNTLLNYAGVKPDLLPCVVDAAPSKQGHFLPGSHIPIYSPEQIKVLKPDYVLILPWNIADEVIEQQSVIFEWGGCFVLAIPELKVIE